MNNFQLPFNQLQISIIRHSINRYHACNVLFICFTPYLTQLPNFKSIHVQPTYSTINVLRITYVVTCFFIIIVNNCWWMLINVASTASTRWWHSMTISASKSCLSDSDLKTLYDSIEELEGSGLTFKKGDFGTSWDFQSSFYASMQIVSGAGKSMLFHEFHVLLKIS